MRRATQTIMTIMTIAYLDDYGQVPTSRLRTLESFDTRFLWFELMTPMVARGRMVASILRRTPRQGLEP
jgi:hypothetical protein